MISYKRDVLERQSLSEVKMGRGSPICERVRKKILNVKLQRLCKYNHLQQGSPTFLTPRTGYGLEKILRTCGVEVGGWMGSLKQVYSFILLSAHVEVDSSLASERICAVNAALENSISFFTFTFCMTEVKTITGITIAQSLHVDFVISIGSPSWFKTEVFPVLRCNRNPPMHIVTNPVCGLPPDSHQRSPLHHIDSHTTQLITLIRLTPENYHTITITQSHTLYKPFSL